MKTLLFALTIVIMLVCGGIYLPGCTAKNPPVITSFSASPASIAPGGSITLNWTVAGAKSVTIDNGIGNVAVKGTKAVTPTATTIYILTATNAAGDTTASTQIVVTGTGTTSSTSSSTTDLPTINSFSASPNTISSGAPVTLNWSVANATSVSIQPGIGSVAASGSTTVMPGISMQFTLTATNSNGSNQASAQIIVSPGTAGTSTSTTETTDLFTDTSANTYTDPNQHITPVTGYVTTAYDFITHAPEAGWYTGVDQLTFPGSNGQSQGYALVLNNATLEDNKTYSKVLETHPKWVNYGRIYGVYSGMSDAYTIMPTDHFFTKVGFLKGATAGNVKFSVRISVGDGMPQTIADVTKAYNGSLATIDVPLSAHAGKKASFVLAVDANNESAKQDWAVWVRPVITR